MKTFLGREVRHYYLELTNRCFLACQACARTPIRSTLKPADLALEVVQKILAQHSPADLQELSFSLSGVFGDPIYHPQFLAVIALIKKAGASVAIVTNGAYKDDQWWEKLRELLDERDEITFSIDGLKGTHEIYRQHGSFEQSMRAMQQMRSSKAHIIWKFIVFPHNKHLVNEALEAANKLAVEFELFQTDRTNNEDQFIQGGEDWKPERLRRKEAAKLILKKVAPKYEGQLRDLLEIIPQCESGEEPTFISHEGSLFPCCRPTSDFYEDDNRPYAEPFYSLKDEWNLKDQSLDQVMRHTFFEDFIPRLKSAPERAPYICLKNCSRVTQKGSKLLAELDLETAKKP